MTTIIDVAKRAGVSFKTVSRVFSGEASVRPKTKEKVLKAASELNYQVNNAARTLRSKAPTVVVLLINNPSSNYAQDIQIGAMAMCQDLGLTLVIDDPENPKIVEKLRSQSSLLGVILTPPQSDDLGVVTQLTQNNVPIIRIGTQVTVDGTANIGIDDFTASYNITQYLIKKGHVEIGYISGPSGNNASAQRGLGFKEALINAGLRLNPAMVKKGDFTYVSGMKAAEKLLSSKDCPTAIFACNDEMAAGCLASAYKYNIKVPDALSVVGFDDSPIARMVYPALTTVHQATREMSQKAVTILYEKRRESFQSATTLTLSHHIVERESTSPNHKV